jgi:thiol-disulfide isomerase/thioredoxin
MSLETMEPNPVWVEDAYADTVEVLAAYGPDLTFRVWGGDWCKDCRGQLPDFGAALAAAEVPEENVHHHEVDQDKQGPGVEEYGIEYIPTVVVEYTPRSGGEHASGEGTEPRVADGEEVARFVEEEAVPIAVYLADEIEETLGPVEE